MLTTPWSTLLQTLVALLLVCGAAFLLIRAWGRRQSGQTRRGAPLERVASLSLAGGASVHLVRAGGRTLLLGVTPSSVRLLRELHQDAPGAGSADRWHREEHGERPEAEAGPSLPDADPRPPDSTRPARGTAPEPVGTVPPGAGEVADAR